MSDLIKHCIVDTRTNTVINIIEYETEQTGVPPGLDSHLLCVANTIYGVGDLYQNGTLTWGPNRPLANTSNT